MTDTKCRECGTHCYLEREKRAAEIQKAKEELAEAIKNSLPKWLRKLLNV